MGKRCLIVICGPTSTGKTTTAIKLCKALDGEIISADSRQIYKGADLGTNKIEVGDENREVEKLDNYWIQEGVKIHLYDVISPHQIFSVAEFINLADQILLKITSREKTPFLVGGTGFYIQAFLGETPYSKTKPDWKLRKKLLFHTTEQLLRELKSLDLRILEQLSASDKKNQRRLIRYIEIAKSSGSVKNGMLYHKLPITNLQVIKIGLTASRSYLYRKADLWAQTIVDHGLIEETQALIKQYGENTHLLQGLIYAPTVDFLKGRISKKELIPKIQFQLHAYIRRQLTWFRRDQNIEWFNIERKDYNQKIKSFLKGKL